MDIPPSAETIHEWRIQGVLVDKIKAAFYKAPEDSRVVCFPWFLQNEDVIALAGQPLSTKELQDCLSAIMVRGWRFTGGSEEDSAEKIKVAIACKSVEEGHCHWLYIFLLCRWSLPPDYDFWVDFGFASCSSHTGSGIG